MSIIKSKYIMNWHQGSMYLKITRINLIVDDSSETGELQTKSALNLIVFGPKLEHLDLIE